ncbi:MAG: Rieske 2Fe-2S domain-containing protein [Gallionellaceae bacterium]|nr:Rieske 2Fe-2S domain-containing protein [Gallionellaceae bacterium]
MPTLPANTGAPPIPPEPICQSAAVVEGGSGFRFEVDWHGTRSAAFVIRHHGRAHAYLNRCGHVPVELDWQPGEFFDGTRLYLVCATHGALYDPTSGACLGGRCEGRGLVALPIEERDGHLFLIKEY